MTLRKAKEAICRLCAELRLPKQHEDEAYNYYRLALNKSFTRGRRAEQVEIKKGKFETDHLGVCILRLFILSTESTAKRAHASRFLASSESQCIYSRKDVPKTFPRAEYHTAHARSRYSFLND